MSESFKFNKAQSENLSNPVEGRNTERESTWIEKLKKNFNREAIFAGLALGVVAVATPPAEAKEPSFEGVKMTEAAPQSKEAVQKFMKEISNLKLGVDGPRGEMFLRKQIEMKINSLALQIKSPGASGGDVGYVETEEVKKLLLAKINSPKDLDPSIRDSVGFKVLVKMLVTGWGPEMRASDAWNDFQPKGPKKTNEAKSYSAGKPSAYADPLQVRPGNDSLSSWNYTNKPNDTKNDVKPDKSFSGKQDPFKVTPRNVADW